MRPSIALFAYLRADERLPGYALACVALIMVRVLVVELRPGLATQEG
jgi:hypothetical protein